MGFTNKAQRGDEDNEFFHAKSAKKSKGRKEGVHVIWVSRIRRKEEMKTKNSFTQRAQRKAKNAKRGSRDMGFFALFA
jgi:hypothetical protein